MEKTNKKSKRIFTPEQKLAILQQIDQAIKSGLTTTDAVAKVGIAYSVYNKWKKQLAVSVKSGLRNGKAPVDREKKRLLQEVEKLKEIILSQSQLIVDLKKETNWD